MHDHPAHEAAWTPRRGRRQGGPPWGRAMSPEHHGAHFGGRRGRGRRWAEDAFFGRGPKAARGDVRAAILALLAEQPMHGYQIIRELGERTGGVWTPSPGSVYPTLQLLEEEGLVTGEVAEGKKVFTLTDAGRDAVAARPSGRPAPWDEVGADVDAALVDLHDAVGQVAGAVRQIAHAGTSHHIAAAKALLIDTRRALYRLLAEEDGER